MQHDTAAERASAAQTLAEGRDPVGVLPACLVRGLALEGHKDA